MVYIAHFSFETGEFSSAQKAPLHMHGFFTCVAEAPSVETALIKFETLLSRINKADTIFGGVGQIHLDSCIEIKSIRQEAS